MKAISREKLIKLLQMHDTTIFEDELNKIMKEYGDDWYISDSQFVLTKINRKEV